MDPALLKSHATFKERSSRAADIAKSSRPSTSHTTYDPEASRKRKRKAVTVDPQLAAKSLAQFNYKSAQTYTHATNFGVMAKIVDYMKKRHLNMQSWPLSLTEILDELQVYDVGKVTQAWLREALPSNPRLTLVDNEKYTFKPPYKVKGKNSLLALLERNHIEKKGGVLLSELNDCIPAAEKHIEALGSAAIDVPIAINKRKDHAYFFNDIKTDSIVDDVFKTLWRTTSVDHLDERKIEEYLQKHGIDSMKCMAPVARALAPPKRKSRKRTTQKFLNGHLADILEDYE